MLRLSSERCCSFCFHTTFHPGRSGRKSLLFSWADSADLASPAFTQDRGLTATDWVELVFISAHTFLFEIVVLQSAELTGPLGLPVPRVVAHLPVCSLLYCVLAGTLCGGDRRRHLMASGMREFIIAYAVVGGSQHRSWWIAH